MKPRHFGVAVLLTMLVLSLSLPLPARADVAPPEAPPGANIVPGSSTTQVRMLAETVTLTVSAQPSSRFIGEAQTEADFTMRNLGTETEKMQARFPLTFWNNYDNGFGDSPEIQDIRIAVDGVDAPTRRIDATDTWPGREIAFSRTPWAGFDVTFPPGKDVHITVKYTTAGYGYEPYFALRYILQTGAGWNGTIGAADIIVNLPYPALTENVLIDQTTITGYADTTPGAQLVGNQVRWHFEDFEPTWEDNITLALVLPSYWLKIQDWRARTQKTPTDGEAWGQLGKAIKLASRGSHGDWRSDAAGAALYAEAAAAYEKSVTLLPKDALWHYGYADLLWAYDGYAIVSGNGDYSVLSHAVDELRQSLALDPQNRDALDLANWIHGQAPWAIGKTDQRYDYLILTATPTYIPATATPFPVTDALQPPASATPPPAADLTSTPAPRGSPAGSPVCGGAALPLALLAGLLWLFSKRQ